MVAVASFAPVPAPAAAAVPSAAASAAAAASSAAAASFAVCTNVLKLSEEERSCAGTQVYLRY